MTARHRSPLALAAMGALLSLAAAACQAPLGAASGEQGVVGVIEGEVVYAGAARGTVFLQLYDAADPPPPEGTGRPVSFAVVSADALFGDAPEQPASFTAPFVFPAVTLGRTYRLGAFLDVDANAHPLYRAYDEPTRGDVTGGHLVLDADGHPAVPRRLADIAFPTEEALGRDLQATLVARRNVVLDLELEAERPAFVVVGAQRQALGALALEQREDGGGAWAWSEPSGAETGALGEEAGRALLTLVAQPLSLPAAAEGLTDTEMSPEHTRFELGRLGERRFPRVRLLPLGEDGGAAAAVELELFEPDAFASLSAPDDRVDLDAIRVTLPTGAGGLPAVPPGRYALEVISLCGQTWRIPNELGDVVGSQALALDISAP